VKVSKLHCWNVTAAEAVEIQKRLAGHVSRVNEINSPRFIAGVDISAQRQRGGATGAVVVLSYPQLVPVEVSILTVEVAFPYMPGLLSFRESPILLPIFEELETVPDLVMVDGQGIAHPRRFGIASHLGLWLETPTIGCAKSQLTGAHGEVGEAAGSWAELRDENGEVIGAAVRTRTGSKLVYVSIGHKVDLAAAIRWVLACCRDHRLPEPTRLAHIAAGGGRIETVCVAG
jgi:deoxyribonuclease V